eukprot:Unigene2912_Nuclearia_a/m.8992 Unigene2912_Nuclearia_a/g.8992  ORF Unigene2912_Nuclearia_a/g.8992 Unigene2912_Nuclearia_a/m.8992 type:complete len:170 (-) Unigene2912_Nuclearia_a:109-618(-)
MSAINVDFCPAYAPFFGFAGGAAAMVFSAVGAAIGTAMSGVSIAGIGTFRPDLVMKSLIPVVMAGIIAIYGLVVSVLIAGAIGDPGAKYSLASGLTHMGSGLSVGFAGVAAGLAVGTVGNVGVRGYVQESRLFVGMVLILIFAEVLGLYGLIVSLVLNTRVNNDLCDIQ